MPLGHPNAIDLAAWFDGEGDRQTGEHIDGCARCRKQLDELGRLRSHIRSAPLPDPLEAPPGRLPPSASAPAGRAGALRRLAPLLMVLVFVVVLVLVIALGGR